MEQSGLPGHVGIPAPVIVAVTFIVMFGLTLAFIYCVMRACGCFALGKCLRKVGRRDPEQPQEQAKLDADTQEFIKILVDEKKQKMSAAAAEKHAQEVQEAQEAAKSAQAALEEEKKRADNILATMAALKKKESTDAAEARIAQLEAEKAAHEAEMKRREEEAAARIVQLEAEKAAHESEMKRREEEAEEKRLKEWSASQEAEKAAKIKAERAAKIKEKEEKMKAQLTMREYEYREKLKMRASKTTKPRMPSPTLCPKREIESTYMNLSEMGCQEAPKRPPKLIAAPPTIPPKAAGANLYPILSEMEESGSENEFCHNETEEVEVIPLGLDEVFQEQDAPLNLARCPVPVKRGRNRGRSKKTDENKS